MGIPKVYYIDAQYGSKLPESVYEEINQIWEDNELGNDFYMYKTSLENLVECDCPNLITYIKEQEPNINPQEYIIIHWSW